jgi:predicted transcriptional regulator
MERDFLQAIMECLNRCSFGQTISDIAKEINSSRNTVYRYLGMLEARGLVFKKVTGNYVLYFSKAKRGESLEQVYPLYLELIRQLRQTFPGKEEQFKDIGRNLAQAKVWELSSEMQERIEKLKNMSGKEILSSLSTILAQFNLFDKDIKVRIVNLDQGDTRATYHISNSLFLASNSPYAYHFYLFAGFIEQSLQMFLIKKVTCEIHDFKIFSRKEDSYVEVSVEISKP